MFGSVGKIFSDTVKGVGSMIPGIGDAMAAEEQNSANIAAADKQMRFQERMSNSAYQRGMDDMKKAGLNPMLAFSQGGASTPTGAIPTINSETKSKLGEFAIASATGLKNTATNQQQANTQQMSAESSIKLNSAQAAKTAADTQSTMLDNIKKKRELPIRKDVTDTLDKGSNFVKKTMESLSNASKHMNLDVDTQDVENQAKLRYWNSPAYKQSKKRNKK